MKRAAAEASGFRNYRNMEDSPTNRKTFFISPQHRNSAEILEIP